VKAKRDWSGNTRAEKVAEAQRLRAEGLKHREIGERMGAKRSTVNAWLNDPDGSKSKARKDSYRGVCKDCGKPTYGSNGRDAAPDQCADCFNGRFAERNERLLEMWEAGEPVGFIAEKCGMREQTVRSWVECHRHNGGEVALRQLPHSTAKERYALIAKRIREGRSNSEIAVEVGTSTQSIVMMTTHARRLGYDMPYRSEVEAPGRVVK
jgi:transposase